jgi:outer membrane immunogenic protein
MKRRAIAGIAALLMGGAAQAADLQAVPAAPAIPIVPLAPVFTWTGFYVGLSAGIDFNDHDRNRPTDYNVPEPVTFYLPSNEDMNFTGGVQVGVNWQMGGLVAGLEADLNYLHRDEEDVILPLGVDRPWAVLDPDEIEWYGTVRARLGLAVDRTLLYVTGGVAFTDTGKDTLLFYNYGPPRPLDCADGCVFTSSDDGLQVGWALGAGIEYAVTNSVSFKLEYLHVDFGSEQRTYRTSFPAAQYFTDEVERRLDIVRAGINIRF